MTNNLSIDFLQSVSNVLKVFGHPVRLSIIQYIESGEKTVGQIQKHLDLIQPVTSQHLKVMYDKGIVKYRRLGTTYYYSIANEFTIKILNCVSDCQEKIERGEWDSESIFQVN